MHRDFPAGATVPCIKITVLCHQGTQILIRYLGLFAFFWFDDARIEGLSAEIGVLWRKIAGFRLFQSKTKFVPKRTEVRKGR